MRRFTIIDFTLAFRPHRRITLSSIQIDQFTGACAVAYGESAQSQQWSSCFTKWMDTLRAEGEAEEIVCIRDPPAFISIPDGGDDWPDVQYAKDLLALRKIVHRYCRARECTIRIMPHDNNVQLVDQLQERIDDNRNEIASSC